MSFKSFSIKYFQLKIGQTCNVMRHNFMVFVTHDRYRLNAIEAKIADPTHYQTFTEKEVPPAEDTESIKKEAEAEGKWAEEEMAERPTESVESAYKTGTFKDIRTYLAEKWHRFFYDDDVPTCEAGPRIKTYCGAKLYFLNFIRKPNLNEQIDVALTAPVTSDEF